MSASTSHATGKSTLICQDCGHDSPVTGDWRVTESAGPETRRVYRCPDCGAVVLSQPVLSASRPA